MQDNSKKLLDALRSQLVARGFSGEIELDSALRAAMSTDNSVYQIYPDLIVAPYTADDVVVLLDVMARPDFTNLALTPRGGGTGTNGQSLNRGVILDLRRHMNRLIAVNEAERWADVEPGMVLDDLNDHLRPMGLFFAPEASTSTRCTIGGMVSTDASGKGSRIYGKTSDNIAGLEIACPQGLLSSTSAAPLWAAPMLAAAEQAARSGREAFIANTPKINRRFTGYDLERACPADGAFDWWRLFLGAEGTLSPITRIRVKLRPLPKEKRLIVARFSTFHAALAAATPLLADEPTAIEVMDERVQQLAEDAGILNRLPHALRPTDGAAAAYVFLEFNGDDPDLLAECVAASHARLVTLDGITAVHQAKDGDEIRELWAIRSAGVGLLGKVDGRARPVAFVEDCVVPPENIAEFLGEFQAVLKAHDLGFGMYGHVDVGCLHIRPALDIDQQGDRDKLVAVSRAVFDLTRKYGGIFWGEHGKGVRGAFLAEWIGEEAYKALQQVKVAFDPLGRYNPGKLVSAKGPVMGIATTNFRAFNAEPGDPLEKAFRCNGNAQCLSYQASTPMCPSFKATADLRYSPKGRADALRAWKVARDRDERQEVDEIDLLNVLDNCLGCKACASTCPVQVDVPHMRSVFYADYYKHHNRPLKDRLILLGERLSPMMVRMAPALRPVWPVARQIAASILETVDLPEELASPLPAADRIGLSELGKPLPADAVLVWQDWFTALFDEAVQRDTLNGLKALGYRPLLVEMLPAGKVALNMGDLAGFRAMATRLSSALGNAAQSGVPMIGLDPALVMHLRDDYPKFGFAVPEVLLPQEFLTREIAAGRILPHAGKATQATLLSHCTEITSQTRASTMWKEVFAAIGVTLATPSTGCCGMAGLFGHQKRHQTMSRQLFALSWQGHMQDKAPVAATGFSCRCQAERLDGRTLRHPLGLIAECLEKG
nr:FAD-binding and (Fe-S)-binding domain-containing protein [uncultured Cohaesibacter sp.]